MHTAQAWRSLLEFVVEEIRKGYLAEAIVSNDDIDVDLAHVENDDEGAEVDMDIVASAAHQRVAQM